MIIKWMLDFDCECWSVVISISAAQNIGRGKNKISNKLPIRNTPNDRVQMSISILIQLSFETFQISISKCLDLEEFRVVRDLRFVGDQLTRRP